MKWRLTWSLIKKGIIGRIGKRSIFLTFIMVTCLLLFFPGLSFSQNVIVGRIRKINYQYKVIIVQTNAAKDAFKDKYTFQVLPDTKFYIKSEQFPVSFEGLRKDELLLPGVKVRLITVKHKLIKVFVMEVPE